MSGTSEPEWSLRQEARAECERRPYSPPRLRSLGKVNVITASGVSTKGVGNEDDARRKPQG
jgi:hypothetical protein